MKVAVKSLIRTLSEDDYFNVAWVSNFIKFRKMPCPFNIAINRSLKMTIFYYLVQQCCGLGDTVYGKSYPGDEPEQTGSHRCGGPPPREQSNQLWNCSRLCFQRLWKSKWKISALVRFDHKVLLASFIHTVCSPLTLLSTVNVTGGIFHLLFSTFRRWANNGARQYET